MAVTINIPSQVKTYANLAAFPASGSLKTIYIAEDTNKTYRWTGSVYVEVSASAASGITIGSTAIASGVVGRVLFEGAGNVVQESSSLSWDATNEIFNVVGRINAKSTTAQPSSLIVEGTTGVNYGNAGFVVRTGTGYQATFFAADNLSGQGVAGLGIFSGNSIPFGLQTGAPSGAFFIHNNGNIGIGTNYTNAGFRLDVNGTARVQDNLTLVKNQNAATGVFITNTNNSASSVAAINLTSSSGEAAFAKKPALGGVYKIIAGNDAYIANGTSGDIAILNDTTGRIKFAAGASSTAQMTLFSTGNLGINTTTDAGYRLDVNGTARATSYTLGNYIINQASANQFIVSNPAGASGQLFLYGGTTSQANIQIYGSSGGNTNNILFNVGSTVRSVIFGSTGNVGINTTTDAGYKLDVNGTQRILGNLTISAGGVGTNTFNANINYLFANQNNVYGLVDLQNAAGQSELFRVTAGYSISSGTTSQFILSLRPTYNFTGTYAGIVRGFYYNPTLTSVTGVDHRAIETTSGRVIFGGLPTSSAGLPTGAIWNDAGTLKIV